MIRKSHLYCAVGLAILFGSPVYAQQANAGVTASSADGANDIIVTARRKEERIQDVPLAVTAVTASELERANITNTMALQNLVPSLTVAPGIAGGRSYPTFTIRGQSQSDLTILSDASVSVYQGDIVAARPAGTASLMFDMAAVEVLRGPQGTLFGRNTTGGAVILRPNLPTFDFEGSVEATYGSRDMVRTQAMINVPVNDVLAIRLSGATNNEDGFVRDVLLDRKVDKRDEEAARASVLLSLPSGFQSHTVYNYYHANGGGLPAFIKFANPAGAFNAPATRAALGYQDLVALAAEQKGRNFYEVANGTPIFDRVLTHDVANTTTIPISDSISVKNIAGYRYVRNRSYTDFDGTRNAIFAIERASRTKQFSEELQIAGDGDRFNWIGGLYYFRERGDDPSGSLVGGRDQGDIELPSIYDYPGSQVLTDVSGKNESMAAFFQGSYKFGESGFSLTVGARITRDKRQATIRNRAANGAGVYSCRFTRDLDGNPATPEVAVPLSGCNLTLDKSFTEPTYNISLEYKLAPGKLIYLAHRHGYRAGGFAARAVSEAGLRNVFKPEIVDDIELGFKGDFNFDSMFLRTNLVGFYSNYKDIQRALLDSGPPPLTIATNADKARVWGIEADVLFKPVPWLELSANYAYTNARFKKFEGLNGEDFSGVPFSRTPKNVYTVGGRLTPISDPDRGTLSIGTYYYHSDSYYAQDDGFFDGLVESVNLLRADASWRNIMGSNFSLSVFGTNLLKDKSDQFVSGLYSLGFGARTPREPRTFGVTAHYDF